MFKQVFTDGLGRWLTFDGQAWAALTPPAAGLTDTGPLAGNVATLQTQLAAAQAQIAALLRAQATAPAGVDLTAIVAGLKAISDEMGSLTKQIAATPQASAPGATPPATTPPATAPPAADPTWLSAQVAALPAGATNNPVITLGAGTQPAAVHIPVPMVIKGAGMRKTILDGQMGVGAGHRLAWGKGIIHVGAPVTIADIGFINGGGGDNNSDGEAAIYPEGYTGPVLVQRCAFDHNEDGIFMPSRAIAEVDLTVDGCVFGRNGPNGLPDGRSHDMYTSGKSVTVKNSVFCGTSQGNMIKVRGPTLTVSNNFIGRSAQGNAGRWIDIPGHGQVTSRGNVYVDFPGGGGQNCLGFWDEGDDTAAPGQIGFYDSDGDTFYLSRGTLVCWINHPAYKVTFGPNTRVFWIGAAGATPPNMVIQGPGIITGNNPFLNLTEANRVDSAPPVPADPT